MNAAHDAHDGSRAVLLLGQGYYDTCTGTGTPMAYLQHGRLDTHRNEISNTFITIDIIRYCVAYS